MARKAESGSTQKSAGTSQEKTPATPRKKAPAKKASGRKVAAKKAIAKKPLAKKVAPRRKPISAPQPSAAEDALALEAQNRRYYDAFQLLDIQVMGTLWWQDLAASCIHPGWDARHGWPEVRESYLEIFENTRAIHFALGDVRVHVVGDLGYVTCVENLVSQEGEGGDYLGAVLSTNVFERRRSEWRLIHHHASPFGGDVVEFPEGPLH